MTTDRPTQAHAATADRHARAIIETLTFLDPLAALPRTGWLMRGVDPCESIAAHSYGVAVVAMMLVDAIRDEGRSIDGERVLQLALLHDAPEAATGDIPMPAKSPELRHAMRTAEDRIVAAALPAPLAARFREAADCASLEARVVKAADKLQMFLKLRAYEAAGHKGLHDFWDRAPVFDEPDLATAARVLELLRRGTADASRNGPGEP